MRKEKTICKSNKCSKSDYYLKQFFSLQFFFLSANNKRDLCNYTCKILRLQDANAIENKYKVNKYLNGMNENPNNCKNLFVWEHQKLTQGSFLLLLFEEHKWKKTSNHFQCLVESMACNCKRCLLKVEYKIQHLAKWIGLCYTYYFFSSSEWGFMQK